MTRLAVNEQNFAKHEGSCVLEQNKFHACVLNVANQKLAVNKFVSYELFCPQVDIIYLIYIICYYRQLAIATLDWNRVER